MFADSDTTYSTPLALDSTAPISLVSATQIKVTLAGLPAGGDAAPLKVWYRYGVDTGPTAAAPNTGIYDNVLDTDGVTMPRQVQPIYSPIVIAAPVPAAASIAVSSIGGQTASPVVVAGALVRVAGTYTGTPPTGLNVQTDSGSLTAVSSPVIIGGTFAFTYTAPAAGSHTVTVQETGPVSASSAAASFTAGTALAALPMAGATFQFDASQVATVFSDVGRTALATNGATVRGLADPTGNGNSMAQAGSAPILALNSQNGLPGLLFSAGSGQFLAGQSGTLAAALKSGSFTMLVVSKPSAALHNTSGGVVYAGTGANDSNANRFQALNADYISASRVDTAGAQSNVTASTHSYLNVLTKEVIRFDASTGTLKLKVNGDPEVTATGVTVSALTGGAAWSAFWIGATYGAAFDGPEYEVVVWPGVLATDTQRDAILTYATNKWAN